VTLQNWANNGWLRAHKPSPQEIRDLLQIVERDLQDCQASAVSIDWQFGIAYNAALKLCTILLHAEGYRAEKNLQHYRTIQALPLILGVERKGDADFLDSCRSKRNVVEYDRIGAVSTVELGDLVELVKELREEVLKWLRERHPELV
jgi:hypothetical protein